MSPSTPVRSSQVASPLALLVALALLSIGGCRHAGDLGEAPPPAYRFVLDGRPRVVVIPLDPEIWLAYDATHGSLIRAWKGGVSFEGSVYSGQHGPQPQTIGESYAEGPVDQRVWTLERVGGVVATRFRYRGYSRVDGRIELHYVLIREDGREIEIHETPSLGGITKDLPILGQLFKEGASTTEQEAGGRRGNLTLDRVFHVQGLEPSESLVLETFSDSGDRKSSEEIVQSGYVASSTGEWGVLQHVFPLDRTSSAPSAEDVPYPSSDLLLPTETEAGGDAAVLAAVIPETTETPRIDGEIDVCWHHAPSFPIGVDVVGTAGDVDDLEASFRALYDLDQLYLLVEVRDDRAMNDSEGAFDDDAIEVYLDGGHEREVSYDENDVQYVFRTAADGFWVNGNQLDHPGVTRATSRFEGGYRIELALPLANVDLSPRPGSRMGLEIHVDDDDDGEGVDLVRAWNSAERDAWGNPSRWASVQLGRDDPASAGPSQNREPGLAMRVFSVGHSLGELRRLVPGQTPNINRNLSIVDLEGRVDFGGLESSFLTEIIGFVDCEEAGTYRFRLTGSDGAKLWVGNRPTAEIDPAIGSIAFGEVELASGEHRLLIRHFADSEAARLLLEWQRPGEDAFGPLPASVLHCATGGVKVTSPGFKSVLETRLRLRGGDRMPLEGVHPSLRLSQARPESLHPRVGGIDFLPDGRMLVCSWDPRGDVWLLENQASGDPERIVARRIASGLAEPLGLTVVGDRIFVLQKQELTELIDHDDDDLIDEYRCIAAGWGVTTNFHEFAFGLVWDGEAFWATLATAIDPGGANTQPQNPDRGRVIRITMDGSYEFVAAGLRTPNGVGLGPDGMILVTDNQGDWLPASKLLRVTRDAFFGNRAVDPEGTKGVIDSPPIVWLPQGEIGNSPSEPLLLRDGPWAGQVVHGDVTHGGLKRTYIEMVDGLAQGTVFRFTQGLEAGVNRIAYGPDGGLYVGGIGSTGNWGQNGKLRYGLQRLEYTGAPVFEMLTIETRANGLLIRFTESLAEGAGNDPIDYRLQDWTYVPTAAYGGPKVDERELEVLSATVSADRLSTFLEIPGLREDRVVHTRLGGALVSERGASPWSTEAWTTINRVPRDRVEAVPTRAPAGTANVLDRHEADLGFELLFDGKNLDHFSGWNRSDIPAGWAAEGGELVFDPARGEGGDLRLIDEQSDFELRFDWALGEGGNSGVFYRARQEGDEPPWATGLEYQLLDDARHADGGRGTTSTSACYAVLEAPIKTVREAGLFNSSRIVARGPRIEHWLNGVKVLEFTIGSPDWEERLRGSKFAGSEGYGEAARGAIVLQDHGDRVRFRNLRIRSLD